MGPIDRLRLWVEDCAKESNQVAEMDTAIDDALEEARAEVRHAFRSDPAPCIHWADSDEPIVPGDPPCLKCGRFYCEQ